VWAREVAPKGKWRACFARAATAASGEHDALKHIMFFLSRSVFDDFRQFLNIIFVKLELEVKSEFVLKIIVGLTDDPALNKWAKVRTLNSCKRNRVKSDTVIGYPL